MHPLRTLVRLAQRLQDAWSRGHRHRPNFEYQWDNLTRAWSELQSQRKRLLFAEGRGFTHCLPSLLEDYRWQLDELARTIRVLREFDAPLTHVISLSDLVQELRALESEFGEVIIDDKRSLLRVTTERIVLQGVDLGPFAIEFVWSRIGDQQGSSCFDLIAIEPNPATGRDEVTHPHVNNGELCAGDAAAAIARALIEGRLSDALVLIRGILTHYNSRSAFVQLSEWDGGSCGDCGRRMNREESSCCQSCGCDLCEDCSSSCRSCEETRCASCLKVCEACSDPCCPACLSETADDESVCSACRELCTGCSSVRAKNGLNDDGLCTTCAECQSPSPSPLEVTHAS